LAFLVVVFSLIAGCQNSGGLSLSLDQGAVSSARSVELPSGALDCAEVELVAGKGSVGKVAVSVSSGEVYVSYSSSSGWAMREIQIAVGLSPGDIPQTKSGNPIPGHFGTKSEFSTPVASCVFDVGRYDAGAKLYIAAHAESASGESAWAGGESFSGKSGARYFTCTIEVPSGLAIAGSWKSVEPSGTQVIKISDTEFSWTRTTSMPGQILTGYGTVSYYDNEAGIMVCYHASHPMEGFSGHFAMNRWRWGQSHDEIYLSTYYPADTVEAALAETRLLPGAEESFATRVLAP
jgi:hypothetical protein